MIDKNGHAAMSGELYLEVGFLQKKAHKKKVER